jgi:high affinity Mn2+ porin
VSSDRVLLLSVSALLLTVAPSLAVGPTPPRGEEAQAPLWTDWSGPYLGVQGSAGGLFGKDTLIM